MKSLFYIFIFTLYFFDGYSQNYEYGNASIQELKEKYNSRDSSAHATILYKHHNIEFVNTTSNGIYQKTNVFMRIKIYDKEGFDWASNKIILFEGKYDKEKLTNLEGFTYNLIDDKVEKHKLNENGIFTEEIEKSIKKISFTFPNVREGSIIEFRYSITSPFLVIDDVYLQYQIPVKQLDLLIKKPKYYKYNTILNPKSQFIPEISYPNYSNDKGFQSNYDRVIKISEQNIPALIEEPYSGNINNFRSKLSFELSGSLTREGGLYKDFSVSWDKICELFNENNRFGDEIKAKSFYKKDLEALLENSSSELATINTVENFVKSKVKWNQNYGPISQYGTREAYKKGEGNVADINLLIVSMLRSLGLDANPVILSTRNKGLPLFPTLDGLNYVICHVRIDSDSYFIDATEDLAPNNFLPERTLNWQGMLINNDGTFEWIALNTDKVSVNAKALNIKINDDFSITGKVRNNLTLHNAFNYRKNHNQLTEDEHLKKIESDKGDILISNFEYNNSDDSSGPLEISYNYKLGDAIEEIGGNLYFNPLLFLAEKETPFKLNDRTYPIDFIVPFKNKYMINILLPEGYHLESQPESFAMEFKGGESKFTYFTQLNGRYLQIKVELDINNPLIQPVDYGAFKDFYGKMIEKHGEQIVLVKN